MPQEIEVIPPTSITRRLDRAGSETVQATAAIAREAAGFTFSVLKFVFAAGAVFATMVIVIAALLVDKYSNGPGIGQSQAFAGGQTGIQCMRVSVPLDPQQQLRGITVRGVTGAWDTAVRSCLARGEEYYPNVRVIQVPNTTVYASVSYASGQTLNYMYQLR